MRNLSIPFKQKLAEGEQLNTFITVYHTDTSQTESYTDCTYPVTYFGNVVFSPLGGFQRSAISFTEDLDAPNVDLTFEVNAGETNPVAPSYPYYSSSPLLLFDILRGKYRDCFYRIYVGLPRFPSLGAVELTEGYFGDNQLSRSTFKVVGDGRIIKIQTANPVLTSPNCRNDLGDVKCQIDLNSLKFSSTIIEWSADLLLLQFLDSFPNNPTVVAGSPFTGQIPAAYSIGKITFRTGANAGRTYDVKARGAGTNGVSLWSPLIYTPAIGDEVDLYPGCNRTITMCQAYKNVMHMQAEPFLPSSTTQNDVQSFF